MTYIEVIGAIASHENALSMNILYRKPKGSNSMKAILSKKNIRTKMSFFMILGVIKTFSRFRVR